jgi:hypothetical protein
MPEEESILDARLAEIDRRLRTIQSGLASSDEPAPAAPPAADGAPAEVGRLIAQLHDLIAAHERLLASSRELLAAFGTRQAAPAEAAPAEPAPALGVAAGPFADTAALRRFARSLSSLPEVREVAVREYAGSDRVVVDVHLSGPTS